MSRNALIQFAFFLTWLAVLPGPAGAFSLASNGTARVVVVSDTNAINNYQANYAVVDAMVNRGVISFTGKSTVAAAWSSLVTTQDVVGIKVMSAAGEISGTRPAVVAAVVNGLVEAGVPRAHIVIWDKRAADLRAATYFKLATLLNVHMEGAMDSGYERTNFYLPDSAVVGQLVYGDLEFGQKGEAVGRKSFVTKILSHQITKIISVAPLLSQPATGVTGHLYSLAFGSVDNTRRFEDSPEHIAEAIPEINALPSVGDRTVLCITDALLAQYEGGSSVELHYSTVLNQLWFSGDPVALDTLAIREINRERRANGEYGFDPNLEIYTNAVLLQLGINDPSKIKIVNAK
ncbi:MAG TPA: DUF362 domain-containing protein [Pseudomonadales bacterium]|nr:DUF362 domain-containing protein [Pseudomonadales bacterium]